MDDELRSVWNGLSLGYTEHAGHPLLLKAIAGTYDRVQPTQVQVAAPQECILLASLAAVEPKSEWICMFPAYQSLYEIPLSRGARVRFWKPEETDRWTFSVSDLADLVTPKTKGLIINFPHNPTGAHPTRAELQRIVDVAREHDLWLFSDESFRGLEYSEGDTLPAVADVYEKGISLAGLSKAYGMPGLRIGWLATRDADLLRRIQLNRDYTTICSSAPSEVLAAATLRISKRFLALQRKRVAQNVRKARALRSKVADVLEWRDPRAGTVGLMRLRGTTPASDFCTRVVEEVGIMLLPSTVFDYGDRHVRIGFGRANFEEAFGRFAEFVNRAPAKRDGANGRGRHGRR